MSSMIFTAKLDVEATHNIRSFYTLFSEFKKADNTGRAKIGEELTKRGFDNGSADALARLSVTWVESEKSIDLEIESGSEVSIEFYSKLIDFFDQEGVEKYHARLFDTSSGGVQVWDKPEVVFELDNAKVYLLGDFDDEDDLQENLEGMGSDIIDSVDGCDLVIVGENPDLNLLKNSNLQHAVIIPEDDIWDYFI